MTTERLYYTDSYRTTFRADVVGHGDGGRRVYLDRTAFYPTSGGQPFDTGRLGGIRVADVVDEGERIAHVLEAPLTSGTVKGVVDWGRRFDHMQQHTGQHLLSAVWAETFGYQTVSVHFGDTSATLDLDVGEVDPAQIRRVEARANLIVTENRGVAVSFEDAAAAEGLRKATERSGPLRIVTIAGIDRSACGGTHVRATGEIGAILIRKVERIRKQVRLEFVCGARAVARARQDFEILGRLAASGSTSVEDLPALFDKQRLALKELEQARRGLEEELHSLRARELYDATKPDTSGRRCIVYRTSSATPEWCRGLAQAVTALGNTVFLASLAAPPTLLVASSADSRTDAGEVLKRVLTELGGRGGGNARLAQGALPAGAAAEAALERLVQAVAQGH